MMQLEEEVTIPWQLKCFKKNFSDDHYLYHPVNVDKNIIFIFTIISIYMYLNHITADNWKMFKVIRFFHQRQIAVTIA